MGRGISAQDAASRLEQAGFNNQDRYQKGVSGKGSLWSSRTSAAEANWNTGIQEAVAKKKFTKGVAEAGPAGYDQGVTQKGVANWPTGMQQAGGKYQKKVAKFQPLWDQALPTPRANKRSPQNQKRIQENMDRFVRTAGA